MSDLQTVQNDRPSPSIEDRPYSRHFLDTENASARRIYFKTLIQRLCLIAVAIFSVLALYWGSLWKTPVRHLDGWVIDFDGGIVGQTVVRNLREGPSPSITFAAVSAGQFPGGRSQVENAVLEQRTWVAVAINSGASDRLQASYSSPNATYNGTDAVTVYAAEARNENAYRLLITPSITRTLEAIEQSFAIQALQQFTSTSNISALITTSPQTIIKPISYTTQNVAPFNILVASAITFVGLIYMLILSLLVVTSAYAARQAAGFERSLCLRSLIITRIVTYIVMDFFVSFFFALLSLAFLVDFSRKFRDAGFIIFWMFLWAGMVSVGLALESMITLLTNDFLPYFMILWIIVNISVCSQPIQVLPRIYWYGYATPFYNLSHAMRCIIFATKNQIGLNIGVLLTWIAISCISLSFFQWFVRHKSILAYQRKRKSQPRNVEKRTSNGPDAEGNVARRV